VAIKYFCDRCQREAREWDLKILRVIAPPDLPVTLEVCPECVQAIRAYALEVEHMEARPREHASGEGRDNRGWLPVPVAASVGAALPLLRGVLYVGIAVLFFFLGSWLFSG
jgi:hypothetical protein